MSDKDDRYVDEAVLLGMSLAAIQLLKDYRADITDYIRQYDHGDLSAGRFRSKMSRLIDDRAQDMYANSLTQKLTAEDKKLIKQWVQNQVPHLQNFVEDKANDVPIDIPFRSGLWVASLGALGTIGFMRNFRQVYGTWYYGATEQHCETCSSLHGHKRPMQYYYDNNYIPQQPGSESLSCKGWSCLCEVRDDDGLVLLPLYRRPV